MRKSEAIIFASLFLSACSNFSPFEMDKVANYSCFRGVAPPGSHDSPYRTEVKPGEYSNEYKNCMVHVKVLKFD